MQFEPSVNLADTSTWLIEGVLPKNKLTLLSGTTRMTSATALMNMAVLVSRVYNLLPEDDQLGVLWIPPSVDAALALNEMVESYGKPRILKEMLSIAHKPLTWHGMLHLIRTHKPRLTILDGWLEQHKIKDTHIAESISRTLATTASTEQTTIAMSIIKRDHVSANDPYIWNGAQSLDRYLSMVYHADIVGGGSYVRLKQTKNMLDIRCFYDLQMDSSVGGLRIKEWERFSL